MIPALKSKNPVTAARHLRDHLSLPEVPRAPDLNQVVRLMGAEIRTFDPTGGVVGRTEVMPTPNDRSSSGCADASWVVSTEKGLPLKRLRFTLAHEIGHLFLRLSDMAIEKEERWCNDFAAELLMPHRQICERFEGRSRSIETVESLSGYAQVSFNAAFFRLNHVLNWKKSLITFELIDGRWCVTDMVFATDIVQYRLDLAPAAQSILGANFVGDLWVPFLFQQERVDMLCDCVQVNKHKRKAMYDRDPADRICREIDRELRQRSATFVQ
jgi:hypothetical protein